MAELVDAPTGWEVMMLAKPSFASSTLAFPIFENSSLLGTVAARRWLGIPQTFLTVKHSVEVCKLSHLALLFPERGLIRASASGLANHGWLFINQTTRRHVMQSYRCLIYRG